MSRIFLISACKIFFTLSLYASELTERAQRICAAYPDHIAHGDQHKLMWTDGTVMQIESTQVSKTETEKIAHATLADQLLQPLYAPGTPATLVEYKPTTDSGRVRHEPFFRKMYGNSPQEVEAHLETIDWMPAVFGAGTYPLQVTRVNDVSKQLQAISKELELLVLEKPHYRIFLSHPGGTYCWRVIANTNRLSNHSFGMTIDINVASSHYWQWDLKAAGIAVTEDAPLEYHNNIPYEIVLIFEKHGFIWGGKWKHYDTMHFEYRPELFPAS